MGALTVKPQDDKNPTASPDANTSSSPSPNPTLTPTKSPIPSQKPASTPNSSPTPSPEPTITPTSPTTAPTPTPAPTATPSPTPTPSPISTPSPIPTPSQSSLVFNDSFQSGNMSAWTNTDSNFVHLEVKNSVLECSTNGAANNNWGYVYKWLNQTYRSLDWRWYLYFENLPTTDGNVIGAGGIYNSAVEGNFTPANCVCNLNVLRQNGSYCWSFDFVNGTSVYSLNSTSTVSPNVWYLIELKAVQGTDNGEVHFYLNDEEILNATGLANNNNNGIDHVSVGGGITADQAVTWYCASAVASTEHVGPQPLLTTEALSLTNQAAANIVSPSSSNITNTVTAAFISLGSILSPILFFILGNKINK